MTVKSFRGLMGDGDIETISLHTNDGSTGYKIIKLQLFAANPGLVNQEMVVKVFSIPQTTATSATDFSDNTLLAVSYYKAHEAPNNNFMTTTIFDNAKFNQDIHLTCKDASTGESVNYYIELEQVKLSLDENTVATLKDIRNIEAQNV
tara:strand:- start:23 stop:466 length:444 start_codon:yes stop_codon:yes gene_type:complete